MAGARAVMKSVEFRREREASWRQLERLVDRVERHGIAVLSQQQLLELPVLHRAAISSLSVARAVSLDRNLLEYLEGLTARSFFCVYGVRRGFVEVVVEFVTCRFPATVRASRRHVALAAAILIAGVIAGFALTSTDADRFYGLVSEEMAQGRDPSATTETLRRSLYGAGETDGVSGALTLFATLLFQHNTQVGILCFALGFAAGVPVLYLLFSNGLVLGAMSAVFHARGLASDWWGWVLPHGVTELTAIVLCGAAGLVQAEAVVFPGRRTRLSSLAAAGRPAGVIVVGSVLLFAVAALIEGIFRQVVLALPLRLSVVVLSVVVWGVYFARAGRTPSSTPPGVGSPR